VLASSLASALLLAGCAADDSEPGPPSAAPEPSPAAATGPIEDLHVECVGEGGPTVVLIAGLNTSGEVFTEIADRLAGTTQTCWYDRAGIGASPVLADDAPDPSPGSAAADLRATLAAQGIDAPYVVLGWSYGGLVAQAYAAAYPEDLAGLVLEDTSIREQFTDPQMMELDEEIGVHWAEGGREIDTEALLDELASLDFGDLPLAVLSQDARGAWGRAWLRYHDDLARASTDGMRAVGIGSGHEMHVDVPDLVVAAVQTVVAAGGTGSLRGACEARLTDAGGRCRAL
jgi:pimeloyl-ACP methyl ester carboxylesterase